MIARVAVLAVALVCLAGCGDDGAGTGVDAGLAAPDAGPDGPMVQIGAGESAFEPIAASGAELEVVMGPQGGWHVWLSCLFSGLSPDGLLLSFDVREDGRAAMWNLPAEYALTVDRVTPDGTGYLKVGTRAVFDIMSAAEVVGRMVTVRACLTPPGGAAPACDSRLVRLVDNVP